MENTIQQFMFHQCETSSKSELQSISAQKGQLLSKKIETAMKQKKYNRQQFANIMGVQPSIITRWLSGGHNFTVETLFDIEEQLDIQLIAIDKPVYKQMSFHMVVGSPPTQHLQFINGRSIIWHCSCWNVLYRRNPKCHRRKSQRAQHLGTYKVLNSKCQNNIVTIGLRPIHLF